MSIFTIHAGHNKQGKIACGASDYLDESKEARYLVRKICSLAEKDLSTVVTNCTVNNGKSQKDVLEKILKKVNQSKRIFDVSIHFNACSHSQSDKKIKGAEVYVYSPSSAVYNKAFKVLKNLEKLGFTNRGVKFSKDLYFLKHSNKPSMLIEVCFVDDEDDAKLYKSCKAKVAQAIFNAIK